MNAVMITGSVSSASDLIHTEVIYGTKSYMTVFQIDAYGAGLECISIFHEMEFKLMDSMGLRPGDLVVAKGVLKWMPSFMQVAGMSPGARDKISRDPRMVLHCQSVERLVSYQVTTGLVDITQVPVVDTGAIT